MKTKEAIKGMYCCLNYPDKKNQMEEILVAA